jgi:hypothetical protein
LNARTLIVFAEASSTRTPSFPYCGKGGKKLRSFSMVLQKAAEDCAEQEYWRRRLPAAAVVAVKKVHLGGQAEFPAPIGGKQIQVPVIVPVKPRQSHSNWIFT